MGAELIFIAIPLFLLLLMGLLVITPADPAVPADQETSLVARSSSTGEEPQIESLESTAHPLYLTVYSHDPGRE